MLTSWLRSALTFVSESEPTNASTMRASFGFSAPHHFGLGVNVKVLLDTLMFFGCRMYGPFCAPSGMPVLNGQPLVM